MNTQVGAAPALGSPPRADLVSYHKVARRIRLLSWVSLVWIAGEGAIAIAAGIVAGSIALIGFGLDSVIEGLASGIIIWRFTGSRITSHAAELRAQRLVAFQFFLLAPYVAFESIRALLSGADPEVSWLGIALAATSAVGMPALGFAKQRLAAQIGSMATRGEGRQNILCGMLAWSLLVGLLANALFGAGWLDAVVGLLIAAVAVKEGFDTLRGESCCVPSASDTLSGDDCRT